MVDFQGDISALEKAIPVLRTVAMPRDTNPAGNIFGGWIVSQMDLAGGAVAHRRAHGPVVTVAIEKMTFDQPVVVGDEVSCYANIHAVGTTSMTIDIIMCKRSQFSLGQLCKVTEGRFVYVALDKNNKPRPIA